MTSSDHVASELFAPLGPTYDRYARVLSLGQDPRWRRFLVSLVGAGPGDTVLDVACGTGAVALELVRAYGCRVAGVDRSPEMLAVARRRIAAAGAGERIELFVGRAEQLPFPDRRFDALTFTYLLRYVEDPGSTMRELARTVRAGGRIAMLEFALPRGPARAAWELYTRVGLPLLGRAISPGWSRVGDFLGPSIREFWRRYPPEAVVRMWEEAGIKDVRVRRLSLGGGVVFWGTRGA